MTIEELREQVTKYLNLQFRAEQAGIFALANKYHDMVKHYRKLIKDKQ